MQSNIILAAASWIVPLVMAIVLHEIAHGWVAYAFGDTTAKRLGRLSLNPLRHVDPFGTVLLPMMLALSGAPVFGWAKPVPVEASRLRNPRYDMMLVGLAGPAMNFLLALLSALALAGVGARLPFLAQTLRNFLIVNVFLGLFNLLPVPPFDGSHVVEGLLPRRMAAPYRRLRRFAFPLMIVLLVLLPMIAPGADIVQRVVMPPFDAVIRLLGGDPRQL